MIVYLQARILLTYVRQNQARVEDMPLPLQSLLYQYEGWLLERVLQYAHRYGYAKYSATLEEGWRLSIVALSDVINRTFTDPNTSFELRPDGPDERDAPFRLVIEESRRHRMRGVSLPMFLGLLKYYRRTYQDLLDQAVPDLAERMPISDFLVRLFDRLEVACLSDWARTDPESLTEELRTRNLSLTNERNKYLTIFESLPNPVILIHEDGRADHVNQGASALCKGSRPAGGAQPAEKRQEAILPDWLKDELADFISSQERSRSLERWIDISDGCRKYFEISLRRIPDVGRGTASAVIILNDFTERQLAEEKLLENARHLQVRLDYILSPGKETGKTLTLPDMIELDTLQEIQDAFAAANRVASIISDPEGNPITKPSNFSRVCLQIRSTPEGAARCVMSDRTLGEKARQTMRPAFEKCLSCGFVDASAPIIVAGRHIANWLIGQSNVMEVNRESIADYAREIGADVDEMLAAFDSMEQMSLGRFKEVLRLLWYLAREISTLAYNNLQLAKDIEERRKTEVKLKESERRLEFALEGSGGGVWDWNPVVDDLFMSPRCREILGISPADSGSGEGSDQWTRRIHPDDRDRNRQEIRRVLKGITRSYVAEYRTLTAQGNWRWVQSRGKVLERDPAGKALRVVGILTDITERKALEEEVFNARRIDSLGVLAGGIAHDFNNLLTAILGNISLGRMMLSDEDHQAPEQILGEAETACMRARELTQQLLTFAKGGHPITRPGSIADLVRSAAGFALRGARSRCEFSFPEDLWPVEMDNAQIGQVVHNLVLNADQAMPQGGVVRISGENFRMTEEQDLPLLPGRYAKITITDPGVGINPECLPRIFDPYFTTKEGNTGLGLATCYSIVRKHRGYITVASVQSEGTTFSFYLPAADSPAVPVLRTPEDTGKGEILSGNGRILIMDDQEMVLRFLARVIQRIGYRVETAEDGAKALDLYRNACFRGERFDAVIMDLTIPGGIGGKELVGLLREIDPHVIAIASSGYSNDPIMSDFRKYGFKGVIAKPYRIGEMSRLLKQAIEGEEVPS